MSKQIKMACHIDLGKVFLSLFHKDMQIPLKEYGCELYMSRHSGLGNISSLELSQFSDHCLMEEAGKHKIFETLG